MLITKPLTVEPQYMTSNLLKNLPCLCMLWKGKTACKHKGQELYKVKPHLSWFTRPTTRLAIPHSYTEANCLNMSGLFWSTLKCNTWRKARTTDMHANTDTHTHKRTLRRRHNKHPAQNRTRNISPLTVKKGLSFLCDFWHQNLVYIFREARPAWWGANALCCNL